MENISDSEKIVDLNNDEHFNTNLNISHIGLYQQLYIPQFNAPNPNMIELEKLYKRYPKDSRPLFLLDLVLIMILLFNISFKFNSLSLASEFSCNDGLFYFSLAVIDSLSLFGSCFLLAFAITRRNNLCLKIYCYICYAIIGFISIQIIIEFSSFFKTEEKSLCQLTTRSFCLILFCQILEICIIVIFSGLAERLRKLLDNIKKLKEKIIKPIDIEIH